MPGTRELQIIEQLSSRWEIKKTLIAHSLPILIVQSLSEHRLATCCSRDLCMWSVQKQEKLTVFEDFPMSKIISVMGTFVGCRSDGAIYCYARPYGDDRQQIIEEE